MRDSISSGALWRPRIRRAQDEKDKAQSGKKRASNGDAEEKDEQEDVLPESERGYRWRVNIWGHATGKHLTLWGSHPQHRVVRDTFIRLFSRAHLDMTCKLSHEARGMSLRERAPIYEALEALEGLISPFITGGSGPKETHGAVEAAKAALKKAIQQFEN